VDQLSLQNKAFGFNGIVQLDWFRNPKTERGMADHDAVLEIFRGTCEGDFGGPPRYWITSNSQQSAIRQKDVAADFRG
jgi:hypothetical protein